MKIISDQQFAAFLESESLYKKVVAVEQFENKDFTYSNPLDFSDKPFRRICPIEKEEHTFRTFLRGGINSYARQNYDYYTEDAFPIYFDEKTEKLDITFHLRGICQSCKTQVDFLIKSFSDKEWRKRSEGISILIQKIGQWPALETTPNKTISKYLIEEDLQNYKRALTLLASNYGIGAFAYYRRIIENEIKRIIKDLSELEYDGANLVKDAYNKYLVNHQMAPLLEVINKYLPKSFSAIGDNPIKFLYEQSSVAIHELPDEECVNRAKAIDIILTFVISKLNEEKYYMGEVRDAMK